MMKRRLFTPGPTPVPEHVMLRMAQPLIHHRTPEFKEALTRVDENLQYVFQTKQIVITLTSSGTGALEAAVTNLLSPGDTMIFVNGGKFGERWGKIAAVYGIKTVEITMEWGTAVSPERVVEELKRHPEAKAVMITHSETSTGVYTNVQAIAAAVKANSNALTVVDGITSVGAHKMLFDEWGIDCIVTGSQKGLMIPPGLAFICFSERGWKAVDESKTPKFYFDMKKARKSRLEHDTPWTPALQLVLGLDEALAMMRAEGMEEVWARHERLSRAVRAGCTALGLKLFGNSPSHAVSAVWLPEGVDGKKFLDTLKHKYGVMTAGGQDAYKGKIFRISHLGYYDDGDVGALFTCIEHALLDTGYTFTKGAGIGAAISELLA